MAIYIPHTPTNPTLPFSSYNRISFRADNSLFPFAFKPCTKVALNRRFLWYNPHRLTLYQAPWTQNRAFSTKVLEITQINSSLPGFLSAAPTHRYQRGFRTKTDWVYVAWIYSGDLSLLAESSVFAWSSCLPSPTSATCCTAGFLTEKENRREDRTDYIYIYICMYLQMQWSRLSKVACELQQSSFRYLQGTCAQSSWASKTLLSMGRRGRKRKQGAPKDLLLWRCSRPAFAEKDLQSKLYWGRLGIRQPGGRRIDLCGSEGNADYF